MKEEFTGNSEEYEKYRKKKTSRAMHAVFFSISAVFLGLFVYFCIYSRKNGIHCYYIAPLCLIPNALLGMAFGEILADGRPFKQLRRELYPISLLVSAVAALVFEVIRSFAVEGGEAVKMVFDALFDDTIADSKVFTYLLYNMLTTLPVLLISCAVGMYIGRAVFLKAAPEEV